MDSLGVVAGGVVLTTVMMLAGLSGLAQREADKAQAIAARADALDARLRDEFERGMAVGYARGVDSVRDDFGAVVEMVGIIADGCVYLPQSQRLDVKKEVGK
jgi:hypothetical protein